jgi:hypothetical protein
LWLDYGHEIDVVYLDYRRVLENVPHKRLTEKIRRTGITGNLLKWIEGFLKNGNTRIKVSESY